MPLELTLITPERSLRLGGLRSVMFQTPQGETGILPGHAGLVSKVDCGIIRAIPDSPDGREAAPQSFAAGNGFAKVTGDHAVILLHELRTASEIDSEGAQAQLDDAECMLATLDPIHDAEAHQEWSDVANFCKVHLRLADGNF